MIAFDIIPKALSTVSGIFEVSCWKCQKEKAVIWTCGGLLILKKEPRRNSKGQQRK